MYIYIYCTKCLCTSILHRHSALLLKKELDCSSPQPKRLLLPPLTSDYLDPRHVKFQHVMATFDWGPKWSKWIQMDPRKTPSATVSKLMWGGKLKNTLLWIIQTWDNMSFGSAQTSGVWKFPSVGFVQSLCCSGPIICDPRVVWDGLRMGSY